MKFEPMDDWVAWRPIEEIHIPEFYGRNFLFAWFDNWNFNRKVYGSFFVNTVMGRKNGELYTRENVNVYAKDNSHFINPTHFFDIDQFDL